MTKLILEFQNYTPLSFSLSIFLKCYKMAPFQRSSKKLKHPWPKYQHKNRMFLPTKSQGKHNQECHNKFSFLYSCIQPIRNHIIYRHPKIRNKFTQVITIFYGFISLCMISFSWRYSTAEHICFNLGEASYSLSFLDFLMYEKRDPYSMYSKIR